MAGLTVPLLWVVGVNAYTCHFRRCKTKAGPSIGSFCAFSGLFILCVLGGACSLSEEFKAFYEVSLGASLLTLASLGSFLDAPWNTTPANCETPLGSAPRYQWGFCVLPSKAREHVASEGQLGPIHLQTAKHDQDLLVLACF